MKPSRRAWASQGRGGQDRRSAVRTGRRDLHRTQKGRKVQITGFSNFETRKRKGANRAEPADWPGHLNQGRRGTGISGGEGPEGTGEQAVNKSGEQGTGNRVRGWTHSPLPLPRPVPRSPFPVPRFTRLLGPAPGPPRRDPTAADESPPFIRRAISPRFLRRDLHQTM